MIDDVPDPAPPPDAPPLPPRYRAVSRLGRGGVGEVWRVRDRNLDRDLALKVLRPDRRTARDAARLTREAVLTGRVQHPGVPAVMERGVLPGGGPFFAMKLVDGRTLAATLAERDSPADDRPRLLAAFRQICEAVGSAHASGVIHRDLKPSNVMIGPHGEVQVMDWGLARLLRGRDDADVRPPAAPVAAGATTRTAAGGDDTRPDPPAADGAAPGGPYVSGGAGGSSWAGDHAGDPLRSVTTAGGSGLGTPAYMAPEQAAGPASAVDERADVSGLGGVLLAILTGAAPFAPAGGGPGRRGAAADLTDALARLDACDADVELAGLCRRCLASAAADRPADGAAVAVAVRAYEAGVRDRLRAAELSAAASATRAAEETKRRRVWGALGVTAALLVAAVAGGASKIAADQAKREAEWAADARVEAAEAAVRRAEAAGDVRDLLTRIALARDAADFDAAATLLREAERRQPVAADPALAADVAAAAGHLAASRNLDRLRLAATLGIADVDAAAAADPETGYAAAFRAVGVGPAVADPAAVLAKLDVSPIRPALVAGLLDWLMVTDVGDTHAEWLVDVLRALAARGDLGLTGADAGTLRRFAATADPAGLPPRVVFLVASGLLERAADPAAARRWIARGLAARPDDFWLHVVGVAAEAPHRLLGLPPGGDEFAAAAGHMRAAAALRPHSFGVRAALADLLRMDARAEDSVAEYRVTLALAPDSVEARRGFAAAVRDIRLNAGPLLAPKPRPSRRVLTAPKPRSAGPG